MKQGILSFSLFQRRHAMRKNRARSAASQVRDTPEFAFFFALLLCGLLAGCFTGMHIPQHDDAYMNTLADLLTVRTEASVAELFRQLAYAAAWPLCAFAVGLGRGRALWLALVTALRGFLLSFVITASIIQGGAAGGVMVTAASVVPALLTVPCLLTVSTLMLLTAQRPSTGAMRSLERYSGILAVCAVQVVLAAVWKAFAVPFLFGLMGA